MALYTYQKAIRPDKLLLEIQATLNILLDGTDGCICTSGSNVDIKCIVALTPTEETTLDAVVAAHTTPFPEMDFNVETFFSRFGEEFTALERLELASAAPNFTTELTFHNFAEIKAIRDYLVTEAIITQATANTITALFTEQSIDLDSL